jgi:cobalt-precorrin 5A hydrolase
MNIAIITLSNEGTQIAARLAAAWPGCEVFLHANVTENVLPEAKRFQRLLEVTQEVFPFYAGLVYIAPAGAVVRAIARCLRHKTIDPGVVVIDVGGRWAVSLLGGHEGGANKLAFAVANILGAEPVVSTTSEALRNIIVGVGCRRGTAASAIVAAVGEALAMADCEPSQVRVLASADIKAEEAGLWEAAIALDLPLRLISADDIRHTVREFQHSEFVEQKVDLPAVAEPAALLAGSRTQLLLPKQVLHGVTVAVAREA